MQSTVVPAATNSPDSEIVSGRLERLSQLLSSQPSRLALTRHGGEVTEVSASHILVSGLQTRVELGSCVEIESGDDRWTGEVIGINAGCATIKLFSTTSRLSLGARVWARDDLTLRPDASWRGRVINALGQPIDSGAPIKDGARAYPIDREPLSPMALKRISKPIRTGVRAIDLFTPLCAGQRIGVFAGSGVGKSTLISMLTKSPGFKTIVVALVAERAREVREFVEDVIGPHRARSVVVVASSSESAMMRKLAAKTAMTIAEFFRDQGDDVLLVVDSITRFAHALREVALAAGEPPVARGYAPSVFAELPRLLERAGPGTPESGSITGIFSVLVDGDDHNEPIADTVRGILDGHIVLERSIADQGRYPAINPLTSISRLAHLAWSSDEAQLVRRLRAIIARFEETRDLRSVGVYKPGSDLELDQAVALTPALYRLLTQLPDDPASDSAFDELAAVLTDYRNQQVVGVLQTGPAHGPTKLENADARNRH
jgi:flagellum-specific ATP synthase